MKQIRPKKNNAGNMDTAANFNAFMSKSIAALHDYWAWMFWVGGESEQTIIPHYMKYWLEPLPLCVALLKVQLLKSLQWWE